MVVPSSDRAMPGYGGIFVAPNVLPDHCTGSLGAKVLDRALYFRGKHWKLPGSLYEPGMPG